ncbi:MAG TPA: squalene/phytoene synthase family protein [Sphingomicrobium sp.]|nr:squalene/phytoene synthase family protein [Sphingomicrobium sp.]
MAERELDPDRRLALEQLPRDIRPSFEALWSLDRAFADIISTTSDPRLGAIRLAWWRERLEALDRGDPVPAEPRLHAVARHLVPAAGSGDELSQLEDAWLNMLHPFPWGFSEADGVRLRGRILFRVGARLLEGDPNRAMAAGELWSLIDVASHCSNEASRNYLLDEARKVVLGGKTPRTLRSLTIITAVAVEGVRRPSSSLARGLAALSHRLTGRIPQLPPK